MTLKRWKRIAIPCRFRKIELHCLESVENQRRKDMTAKKKKKKNATAIWVSDIPVDMINR